MLASTLRHAASPRATSPCGSGAHWIWLNGIGGRLPSSETCTSLLRSRAYSASARTHCDFTASADHNTSTASADDSRSSITSA